MLSGWNNESAQAVLAAMSDVAHAQDDTPKHQAMVEAAAKHVFEIPLDVGSLPQISPDELAAAVTSDEQRFLATQLLVLVPYADTVVDEFEVDRVDQYAKALGTSPDNLADLHKVRQGHIRRLLIDYFRRGATNVQVAGDDSGILKRTVAEIHQYAGDAKITAKYLPLADYDEGTLGRTFFDFYRARGFSLPGEKHSLGEEVVSHDCTHILSGFNTDGTGEINVAGFEAGMKSSDFGFELLMEVILDFQLGIDFGVGLVGYKTKTGEMDPDQMMKGISKGLACKMDIMGPDWSFWEVADKNVRDLRDQYGITGVDEILLPPPEKPATSDGEP